MLAVLLQVYHKRFFEECKAGEGSAPGFPGSLHSLWQHRQSQPQLRAEKGRTLPWGSRQRLRRCPMRRQLGGTQKAAAAAAAVSANLMRPFTLLISICAHWR